MKKKSLISGLTALFLFSSVALFAIEKPTPTSASETPENVQTIIKKSCFGCHNSNSGNDDAKEALDFKKLDSLSLMKKISAYKHIGEIVEENKMPPKGFLKKYPERKLSDEEKQVLIAWAKKEAEALVKGK
ncbi:MAG: heme-binding domain-containing protein [Draconibacterium sp.]|nr:heme-binding domain-containing protein [Draconibacterium sp.]